MKRKRRVDPARLWLAAILLLALSLRVYRLDAQSLWYDEAVTAQVSSQGLGALTRWTADDIQPPLYYYVVAGWTRLAGRSEWALRFPSAFFGVLTVALLWAVARRLFGRGETGRWAAGSAALLAATLPLYVYYAQEARMYTLLTFLGVLAGYALLRTGDRGLGIGDWGLGGRAKEKARSGQSGKSASQVPRLRGATWWIVFVLASVAMLYTHYFGVFLLIAYGLCWLVFHARRAVGMNKSGSTKAHEESRRPSIRVASCVFVDNAALKLVGRQFAAFGLSVLAISLLYLPWLPAMLNRYRVDASYWQGALKLGEALRHVAINFTAAAPEMMLEGAAVRLLPVFGAAAALALIALFWRGRYASQAGILLAVLILPVTAVLLLASRTPKFNPRYLMLASPAHVLLLAGGIAALWRMANDKSANQRISASRTMHHTPRTMQYAIRITLAGALIVALLLPFAVSLRNWFTDPAFTKAQWRELAAFVRAERGPDEAVLLVSGHAYPAWDTYAADIPITRLPASDILDVNAVLGFDAGPALTRALASQRGVWLVTWQDEVVDPVGFVPYFLARGGEEQPVAGQFWHLGLRHWRLDAGATFPAEPQPQHPDGANFDHKLALLGWDDPADGQLTVYWRVLNTLTADYQVSLAVEDAAGRELGRWDGRPAGYDYPTFRWQPGQALFGRYPLPLPLDASAGEYYVSLTVYAATDPAGLDIRDVADNPAGKRVRLGPIKLGVGD